MRQLKLLALKILQAGGAFAWTARSRWRQQRLLILCYHGISLRDEHEWHPLLFLSPEVFESRLRQIRDGGYCVLGLGDALTRLREGTLPPRAVAITFDDGNHDFYARAFPLLEKYGFPATVYQTTYYTDFNRPVFRLICDYMMWQRRGTVRGENPWDGQPFDLRTPESRAAAVEQLDQYATQKQGLTGLQKDELAKRIAGQMEVDWDELTASRILQLMSWQEIQDLARRGIDFQLHTHRHFTPQEEAPFLRELNDNSERLTKHLNYQATHFCYPCGVHYTNYPHWLRQWGATSAVLCDRGLAQRQDDVMLIPRLLDTMQLTPLEFDCWLSGLAHYLPQRSNHAVATD